MGRSSTAGPAALSALAVAGDCDPPGATGPAGTGRDAREGKARLRAWALARRAGETPAAALAAGQGCAVTVLGSEAYAQARVVAGYLSLPGELTVDPILRKCVEDGKFVAVPAWNRVARRYAFCRWTPDCALAAGPMKVPQPMLPEWIPFAQLDLVLVPGLVFDRWGGRIGFGAGHYDRLLARCRPAARFVGMAYAWQVVARVPQGPEDVRLHAVATPEAWFGARMKV